MLMCALEGLIGVFLSSGQSQASWFQSFCWAGLNSSQLQLHIYWSDMRLVLIFLSTSRKESE